MFSILLNLYLIAALAVTLEGGFKTTTVQKGQKDQTVAIYTVSGIINTSAVERFTRFCNFIKNDRNVKAVVLRVESPGGGVTASDQIHNLVTELKAKGKTVVVSMGAVAASGGYYISAGADEIIAEPTTVTGSIGVIVAWPIIKGTLEKIGIEPVVMKSTHSRGWKDEGSYLHKPDSRQRKHLQAILDKLQEKFENIVREGRADRLKTFQSSYSMLVGEGETARRIQHTETEPFNGKIYLADEARMLGLIDRIGYISMAVDKAAEFAGLTDARVLRYEPRRGLLSGLFQNRTTSLLDLGIGSLDELLTPRILLMWKVQ